MIFFRRSAQIILLLPLSIIFSCLFVTFMGWTILHIKPNPVFILIAVEYGLIFGLPAALPLVIFMHWRRYESFKAWFLAGMLSGMGIALLLLYLAHGNAARVPLLFPIDAISETARILEIVFIYCTYSTVASLIYGFFFKSTRKKTQGTGM